MLKVFHFDWKITPCGCFVIFVTLLSAHAIVAERETRDCAPTLFLSYVCKFAHPVVSLCCKAFVYIAIPCLMTRSYRCDSAGIFLSALFCLPRLPTHPPSPRPVASTSCATGLLHRSSHRVIAAALGWPSLEKAMYRTDIEPRQGVISVRQRYSC